MLGAILGDFLGSIYEKIPNYDLRKENLCTDDSYLTCAAIDWLNEIDYVKYQYLFNKNKDNLDKNFSKFLLELKLNAERKLIKWFNIGLEEYDNKNEIPAFSNNFSNWVKKREELKKYIKSESYSNGSLMRNSPIPYYGFHKKLNLEETLILTEIFSNITHYHPDSLESVKLHSTIIFKLLGNKSIYKELLNDLNIKINDLSILEKELTQKKFIWDAKTSLKIALSSIFYSNSYLETINFCNKTNMDTDTYCAIAGPIAEIIWGIDEHLIKNIERIKNTNPRIFNFCFNNKNQFKLYIKCY